MAIRHSLQNQGRIRSYLHLLFRPRELICVLRLFVFSAPEPYDCSVT